MKRQTKDLKKYKRELLFSFVPKHRKALKERIEILSMF